MRGLKEWMLAEYPKVLPSSPIGKAISYALSLWDYMHYYTLHGHLQIDNNEIENAIRPIALGRKNYLFAGTHGAAQNAAMVYSLFATCKKHNVNPQEWLTDVLHKLMTRITKENSLTCFHIDGKSIKSRGGIASAYGQL